VEILRKKVNGATAPETISRIRDVLASGECSVPEGLAKEPTSKVSSSSASLSLEDTREARGDNNDDDDDDDDDDEDDDDVDAEKPDAPRSAKNSSIASNRKAPLAINASLNLSGPVTDL